ncbi:hypothetical protein CK203_054866 [Vitis vinifera]|uniref:Uncharacterized protein n=1 Tax=Vitis vinifera TaxID=29760 RepID=A0A438GAY4_VITVI|nr:hypothetical protein CK203_054866 [Vitis vinifera]
MDLNHAQLADQAFKVHSRKSLYEKICQLSAGFYVWHSEPTEFAFAKASIFLDSFLPKNNPFPGTAPFTYPIL